MSVAEQQLWGGETAKAVENFPVSGERVPVSVVRWLAAIKGAAARVNADLGKLDGELAERIGAAADDIAAGKHDDQFPIDVFQTGSGTSTNMNANEVIANLAGEGAHPNDHVNMGQSSNDVFPSAVHLAALDEATNALLPALEHLEAAFAAKAAEFEDVVKSGRTHLMDAVPVTLGQEFAGYAAQMRLGARRVRNALPQVAQIPLGGTAVGNGLNTHPEFAERIRARLQDSSGLEINAPEDPFEAQANRDALVELSGALKVVAVSLIEDRPGPRAHGLRPARRASARSSCPSCRRARRSCPARSTRSSPRSSCRSAPRSSATTWRSPSAACRATSSSTSASRSSRATCSARSTCCRRRAACSPTSACRGSRPTSTAASARRSPRSPPRPR